jgi:pimeloyl-ACP methyl ester carboxylesterase
VAAILLLDPTHPDHWPTMQRQAPSTAAAMTALRSVAFSSAMRAEFDGQASCLEPPRALQTRIPTRILARTKFELMETADFRNMVRSLEQEWLTLIPGARRVPVEGSGHYIQKEKPDHVAAEIQSMLRELQQSQP